MLELRLSGSSTIGTRVVIFLPAATFAKVRSAVGPFVVVAFVLPSCWVLTFQDFLQGLPYAAQPVRECLDPIFR